ncbi:MAG TPA: sulfite dehydrogenase [Pseudomonadales bacterium]|jgi:sulfane dehydrogenase subunit SoxC|nr:sulfite dehydrogenase [Pseudomonadales bacterium]MDP7314310.1 sulfite dehydrogenase [Pseudomonadales bacterium]HJP52252.1 sulfite dehydrogenase [Pseudomonadales bacterium]|tara:strand:- start:1294 stop:2523 length:1230 start_codon:yes stop_codon:yes gene_type:complete
MSDDISGGGILHRRHLLKAAVAGVTGGFLVPARANEAWMTHAGEAQSEYGSPSRFASLAREQVGGHPTAPEAGSSSTPLQDLDGTITPNSLHFERHHSGIPDIDPAKHKLAIFGEVERNLEFSYENLLAYPKETHIYFLECAGNSFRNVFAPADLTAGALNGLLSCAEWSGVPLHHLLDEAGVHKNARWIIAEGADAAGMARSVPIDMAMDNVLVALYQNGEPLRPAQGYPMRLFVPGSEGNISVKWLHRLKVQETPAYTRDETSKYTDLLKDGRSEMFSLKMEVKSVITSPSGRMKLGRKGVYEISGIAWSGAGTIRKVEVSADGGVSWAEAVLQSEASPLALTRFRIPWRWDGQGAVLQSRAIDDRGRVQPSRASALEGYSQGSFYHYNGIQSWEVSADGLVKNVFV